MRCNRCGYAVPEWLWVGDDHPIIVQAGPTHLIRQDDYQTNTIKVVAENTISIKMCKDAHPPGDSDFIDIGPQCFAGKDKLVISWEGENYYRACSKLVKERLDGSSTHCVKRVGHPNACEDYDGDTRDEKN
jgi:hypothetical protein